MMIRLYQDYVHNNGALYKRLCDHFSTQNVAFCDVDDIRNGVLKKNTALFVMPGGADLYYCEKLNGVCNDNIHAYVQHGGTYLGICAGAYYGCSAVNWAKNEEQLSISGARELAFLNGTAIGPIYEYIEDNDFSKSWDGIATITYNKQTVNILYAGGPLFDFDPDKNHHVTVLARYADLPDTPPAIIECAIGKGKAILSSPHIELSAELYKKTLYKNSNQSYERTCNIQSRLTDQSLSDLIFEKCMS